VTTSCLYCHKSFNGPEDSYSGYCSKDCMIRDRGIGNVSTFMTHPDKDTSWCGRGDES